MEYLYIIGFSSVVIIWLVIKTSKQAVKIDESMQVIKKAGIALTMQEKELAEKNRKIEDLTRQLDDSKGAIDYYIRSNCQLRRDLQKRTDQYNDLVDLAREHNII